MSWLNPGNVRSRCCRARRYPSTGPLGSPACSPGREPARRRLDQHHPLTASAALVWSGDLPCPLQQMLFDAADRLTEPAHPPPADLVCLTTV
jgi:hypothetical protein